MGGLQLKELIQGMKGMKEEKIRIDRNHKKRIKDKVGQE